MAWQPDRLLPGFEALELPAPDDYDGRVVATLVRLPAGDASRGAVLYVHGFIDYFFQRHMAERFAAEGYAFYALDLRKHGRSLLPHQHPCFCKDLAEYFDDLTRALEVIGGPVLLAGHSTGGLVCSLYCHQGQLRDRVRMLWLNSPFLDWRESHKGRLRVAQMLGWFWPFLHDPNAVLPEYVHSLHRGWGGEWEFDLALKPERGFPAYFGWVRAIFEAHAKVHAGLKLGIPVLSMHSDEADIVLAWKSIARWSRTLGPEVTVLSFPGALHDLVLSRREIRDGVFSQLFSWAERAAA
ncbi:MAG TPA: alpha/beta hydrolase [Burkholderiales bacterium]|jgi:alpha-beta hydrolase superfamily lysophospholipase|nr:alpha/beta hydrolase [Burkholderiales bacterium]